MHRQHGTDPEDFTSDIPGQRHLSIDNLHNIIYQRRPLDSGVSLETPDTLEYLIFGQRLQSFPGVLPGMWYTASESTFTCS